MRDDRIDFAPLDPAADRGRFEKRVREIMVRAEPLLAVRRRRAGVIEEIAGWRRPMLAAAAVIAMAAGATLALVGTPEAEAASVDLSIARAIGVPTSLAPWVGSDDLPGPEQLMTSTEVTP